MLVLRVILCLSCLLAVMAAVDAGASCKICFPDCTNAGSGLDGKKLCSSGPTYCKLEGSSCRGSSSGCDCGTMGCEPCDITCTPSQAPAEWVLTRVDVTAPVQPLPQWRLVSVTTARARRS